jgi:probable O-glycosylation ligase (exosortase A-associated)
MRDIVLSMLILGLLPMAARRTWVGVLLWTWLSIMSPHRLTFGFAYSMPWAQMAAVATFISLFVDRERLKMAWTAPVISLMLFIVWVCITTFFSLHMEPSLVQLEKVLKIQLFTLIAFAAIRDRRHIELFVWVNALSIGFYGFKGGLFVIRSGGGERVWGPPGSFIEGNNEVGLAIIMVIPLLYFLRQFAKSRWVRHGLLLVMLLGAVAAIGTYSRGAFLAIVAMGALLWWRAPKRVASGVIIVAVTGAVLAFMPAQWEARMGTIETYEQDGSAMGRINAWTMAFNLANDRFLGAGFETGSQDLFEKYAPIPQARAAHSIYFQVLGEHGWLGLILFVSIGFFGFLMAARLRRRARNIREAQWIYGLAGMLQVSMVGYAVGGAFLSLAYFDLPYNVLVILVACNRWMEQERWRDDTVGAFGSHAFVSARGASATASARPGEPVGTRPAGAGDGMPPAHDG